MLCGLCVLQSLWAFYLGILAETPNPFPVGRGYFAGATAPDQARMLAVSRAKPLHDAVAQMADDLYGGYTPKQGCFDCLPKVLHDAKPTEQAISDTHIFRKCKGISTVCGQRISFVLFCSIHQINSLCQEVLAISILFDLNYID